MSFLQTSHMYKTCKKEDGAPGFFPAATRQLNGCPPDARWPMKRSSVASKVSGCPRKDASGGGAGSVGMLAELRRQLCRSRMQRLKFVSSSHSYEARTR